MYNKNNMAVLEVASQKYYCGVQFAPFYTVATDGCQLLMVTNEKPAGESRTKAVPKAFNLGVDDAGEVRSLMSKLSKKKNDQAELSLAQDGETITFTVKSKTGQTTVVTKDDGQKFPKFMKIWPKETPTVTLKMNVRGLRSLIEGVYQAGVDEVEISIYQPGSPVKVKGKNRMTGQVAQGLIMPNYK